MGAVGEQPRDGHGLVLETSERERARHSDDGEVREVVEEGVLVGVDQLVFLVVPEGSAVVLLVPEGVGGEITGAVYHGTDIVDMGAVFENDAAAGKEL